MSKEYRATPDQWAYQEHYAVEDGDAACLLELRSRLEALEAARRTSPGSASTSLVRRVACAIGRDDEPINWTPEARAAILEISAWLAAQSNSITGQAWAEQLRIEAEG